MKMKNFEPELPFSEANEDHTNIGMAVNSTALDEVPGGTSFTIYSPNAADENADVVVPAADTPHAEQEDEEPAELASAGQEEEAPTAETPPAEPAAATTDDQDVKGPAAAAPNDEGAETHANTAPNDQKVDGAAEDVVPSDEVPADSTPEVPEAEVPTADALPAVPEAMEPAAATPPDVPDAEDPAADAPPVAPEAMEPAAAAPPVALDSEDTTATPPEAAPAAATPPVAPEVEDPADAVPDDDEHEEPADAAPAEQDSKDTAAIPPEAEPDPATTAEPETVADDATSTEPAAARPDDQDVEGPAVDSAPNANSALKALHDEEPAVDATSDQEAEEPAAAIPPAEDPTADTPPDAPEAEVPAVPAPEVLDDKKRISANEEIAARRRRLLQMDANPYDFVHIGDQYYRIAEVPDANGGHKMKKLPVCRQQIFEDFPTRDQRALIPRYIGSTVVPQNVDYQRTVDGFYNEYAPPVVTPKKGLWPHIEAFLKHIFGKQYRLALDYFYLLYLRPTLLLPVLILVSLLRGTGKTTLLKWLAGWFGGNMAYASNESFRSKFNADWAGKHVVGIDETFLNRRADGEKLKSLATSQGVQLESKFHDRNSVDNFMHFILATNNVCDPLIIDPHEDRYWVVEVPPPAKSDPDLLDNLLAELPAFTWYLIHQHQLTFPTKQGRFWFPLEAYATDALRRIQGASIPDDQHLLAEVLTNVMDELGVDEISMTITEMQQVLSERGFRSLRMLKTLRAWPQGLYHAGDNLAYDSFVVDGKLVKEPVRKTGRYYTFAYNDLAKLLANG